MSDDLRIEEAKPKVPPKLSPTHQRIIDDRKAASRDRNAVALSLLNPLLGDIQSEERRFDPAREITETEVQSILKSYVKRTTQGVEDIRAQLAGAAREGRAVSSEAFAKAEGEISRLDAEKAMLLTYLPAQLGEDEIEAAVREFVAAQAGPASRALKGRVMKHLKDKFGAALDGKLASQVTDRVLTG
jgi:uncharacterized protein YqeY